MSQSAVNHILVPVDNSACAGRALELAAELAERLQVKMTLLHAIAKPGSLRTPPELKRYAELEHVEISEHSLIEGDAKRLLENSAKRARELGAVDVHTTLYEGRPSTVILDYVEDHGVDLVVLGRRGLGNWDEALLGSVSQKVLHATSCACLLVR